MSTGIRSFALPKCTPRTVRDTAEQSSRADRFDPSTKTNSLRLARSNSNPPGDTNANVVPGRECASRMNDPFARADSIPRWYFGFGQTLIIESYPDRFNYSIESLIEEGEESIVRGESSPGGIGQFPGRTRRTLRRNDSALLNTQGFEESLRSLPRLGFSRGCYERVKLARRWRETRNQSSRMSGMKQWERERDRGNSRLPRDCQQHSVGELSLSCFLIRPNRTPANAFACTDVHLLFLSFFLFPSTK